VMTAPTASSVLSGHVDYIVIASNSPVIVALHDIDHGRHQRSGSTVEAPTVQDVPDKQAGGIQRQGGYVRIELLPVLVVLEQILLDVGCVEHCQKGAMLLQIFSDRSDRLRSGKVPDQGHDQIPFLHAPDGLVLILSGEEVPIARTAVVLSHQIAI